MLVLARKEGESIRIGDDIILEVVSVKNGVVKIGIEAPGNIAIFRNELFESIKKENIKASGLNKGILEDLGNVFGDGED